MSEPLYDNLDFEQSQIEARAEELAMKAARLVFEDIFEFSPDLKAAQPGLQQIARLIKSVYREAPKP